MVNPVLPANVTAGQAGHVADHNTLKTAIQTVADAVTTLEGNGSITTARLADSAVTSAKIADGAIVNADVNASAAIDVSKLSGVMASSTVGNLLSATQAAQDDETVWAAAAGWTRVVDTTDKVWGTGSVKFTANTTGIQVTFMTSRVPVVVGNTYTMTAAVQTVSGTRGLQLRMYWYNAATGGTLVASTPYSTTSTASTSWTRLYATGVAPAGATHLAFILYAPAGAVGDEWRIDAAGIWQGAGGEWTMPGVPVPHLGQLITESSTTGRAAYLWDDNNSRYQVVYYDTGWRDISSLLVNGWTGSVFLRRSDNIVMLRTSGLNGAAATANTILTIPTGFRTESTIYQLQPVATTGTTAVLSSLTSAGVYAADRTVVTGMSATWSYSTTNTLPTSLPGTASGTIPAN